MPAFSPTTFPRRPAGVRCAGFALAALIATAVATPSALAAPASYAGASAVGHVVFFTTTEQLVPGDADSRRDVYERSFDSSPGINDYVTREISTGPTGGNDAFDALFEQASSDGTRVFFSTDEPLVPADTDHSADVYMRDLTSGTTTLVSQGESQCAPGCGNGPADSGFAGANSGGTEAFFVTDERLATADTDNAVDVYERNLATDTTTLVSAGGSPCLPGCGNNDNFNAVLRGISPDGTRAFFATFEQLSSSDTDTAQDLYARDLPNGPTTLVSQGDPSCAPCGNSNSSPAVFAGSSTDGSKVFFETDEGLVTGDADGSNDLYQRAGGATTLISGGASSLPANFMAASSNGADVFFVTAESLVGGDTNGAVDVYEWSGGAPVLVTSGTCTQGASCGSTFDAATADGTKVLFTTTEQLDGADTDTGPDVYRQDAPSGTPVLVSQSDAPCAPACGNGPAQAIFNGISTDASKVFFTSTEALVPQDVETPPNAADIYMRDLGASTTTLESPPGVCPISSCDAVFNGASTDGAHVFFQTSERLTADDIDSEIDVYERTGGVTHLVSTGNSVTLGPATPVLTGTNPASPNASTTPAIVGQADPNTSIKLYTTADCSGIPVATGTSLDLGGVGIAVTVGVGSTTSFRATATDTNGDTSSCSAPVSYTQQNAPPPPDPGSGGGTGSGSGGSSSGGQSFFTPETLITFAPASKTKARRPVFRFTDTTGQPGTTFLCKVDGQPWQACNSPVRLKRLRWGKHTFQVVAVNAVGTRAPNAVKRRFKVVRG